MAQMKQKLRRSSDAVVSVIDIVGHIKEQREQGDKLYSGKSFKGKWILCHGALAQLWFPFFRAATIRDTRFKAPVVTHWFPLSLGTGGVRRLRCYGVPILIFAVRNLVPIPVVDPDG